MVRTCVDSSLNELTQLERSSSLPASMKSQIQNLQLDLRFLKMLFWCYANWEDAAEDVLMGSDSDLDRIQDTLRRAGQGLYAAGSIAIRGVRTDKWDLISGNLLETVKQLKPQIAHVCLDLLDESLQCTYSTSQEILEFTGAILKNLKEFLHYKADIISPPMKNQITDLEEILGFLRNFIDVTERWITGYEKFQEFWNDVQTRANNAACVSFLYWIGDQMDVTEAPRMSNILSDPLQKIKPCVSKLAGMYLGVLKVSEPAQCDPVMSEIAASFVDFLLQYLPVSMKGYVPVLGEGLMFLVSFLVHPPSDPIKSQGLYVEADAVLSNVVSLIYRTNKDIGEHKHILLRDFPRMVSIIRAKVKELYVETSDLSLFDFPKTNGPGFIDFFLGNLKEMLEIRKAFLKPFEKEKIARILNELLWLRCFLGDSFELRSEEMDINRMRILNVTYKAEHVIDSLMHFSIWYGMIRLSDLIEEIESIKIDVKRMEENIGVLGAKMTTCLICTPAPDTITTFNDKSDAVGFDDEANAAMDMLLGGSRELQIVLVAGMPGIGKTTLANKVYNHRSVKLHFHKRAWCSVSRVYRSRELLLDLLVCVDKIDDRIRDMAKEDLADLLRKNLLGRRYLIVIDGIWEVAAWNELKDSFPSGEKGSRIVLTSQIDNLASETQLPFHLYHLQPLSESKSWELFLTKLSSSGECPALLLEVGQQIVQNCEGLPLAIVTIAGLLSRTDKKLELWTEIAQSTSSFLDEEGYKKILELSYNYLPDYLKPLFLYFGAFQDDKPISARKLIQLWVAEGFVLKMKNANIEDVAKQHLKDLIVRNLVIVTNRGSNGKIKACRMHNLLRELCVVKVKQESFLKLLYISQFSSNSEKYQQYRLCIYPEWLPFVMSKSTGPHVRSLLFSPRDNYVEEHPCDSSFFINFKLLRVLNLESIYLDGAFPIDMILLIHLRYLALWGNIPEVPSSIEKLWKLETFVVKGSKYKTHLPNTICNMKRLKHVHVGNISLGEFEILESAGLDVETFGTLNVSYGEAAEKLLRRLEKVRKLKCILSEARNSPRNSNQIPGLEFPKNLKSLNVLHNGVKLNLSTMKLPETLEKLTLSQCGVPWSQISIIKELPNLQVLKLLSGAFVGETWDVDDFEFPKLKFLKLFRLDIGELNASSDSFPVLKHLVVERCSWLTEIPYGLGEIPTLEKIEVRWCSKDAADSARKLQEDFEHLEILISTQMTEDN